MNLGKPLAKILVVEDEPAIADMLRYALSSEGYAVNWVVTGTEAITQIRSEKFAAAIFDVGLPDTNGFDLYKNVRTFCELPVIFLTARGDEIDRVVGLELGADDYIVKPFSPRELVARLKNILKRTSNNNVESQHQSQGVPFRIDQARHQIFYFDQLLDLPRYEFRLLKVLIERPGRVFTREHLMALVWDDPDASMERTVDAHIKQLRQKLKALKPDIEAILTHRGVGYALRENW